MPKLNLYNSLTKKVQLFTPLKRGIVDMYACGPTVYQEAHIGNLRTYIFEDTLRRVLEYNGYKVKHIMNVTDVGHLTSDADTGLDKVEAAAKKEHKTPAQITKHYFDLFKHDLQSLNVEMPHKFAWATKYIKEQVELVKLIDKKGYAYATKDGIYFDTVKFKPYGRLGRQTVGESRIENDLGKKHPTDFALWKFSKSNENRLQEWKTPWGIGYPGWHLECSAIATKELGRQFDIHTGGEDHLFIHHNNEIAQNESAFGKILAKYWLHGAFMLIGGGKMAKSKGNFVILQKLKGDPLSFRYLVITSHYRQPLNYSLEALENAQNSLNKLRALFSTKIRKGKVLASYKKEFLSAINNDLNMPEAMVVIWKLVKSNEELKNKTTTLLNFDKVLGLNLAEFKVPTNVAKLRDELDKARQKKTFDKADKLRVEIDKLGWEVSSTEKVSLLKQK